jgi:hypothetical protein
MAHENTRPEIIVAALFYLITAYQRVRCPALAACIAHQLRELCGHPATSGLLRNVAAASLAEWETAARNVSGAVSGPTRAPGFALH